MTTIALRSPSFAAVVREQLRASGLRLRLEAAAAALVVAGLFVVELLGDIARGNLGVGSASVFHPEGVEIKLLLPALGLLLPLGLWRGESMFGNAPLLSLPVERRRHVLIKVFAGWCWLLATIVFVLAAPAMLALLTGGSIQVDEMRNIATLSPNGEPVLTQMRWTTQPWQWLVPLLAASVAYLLSSAFLIGVRHPWRWSVGFLVAGVMLSALGPNDGLVERALQVLSGESGLLLLLNGTPTNSNIGGVEIWQGLPSFLVWAKALAVWLPASLGLLWLAASRHKG
jgi:hypothetical protein